ncbi:MAG: restriction endonuclease subunit S [Phocaeicola sp.]|uniref:restriction endonuclease subunit S n=1 Tax=Phocaeicola sp. TaxID=2773926 RepID=UPI003FA13C0C
MYKLKDFAQDISVAIKDAQSSPFDRFVGLEHYDSGEPVITRYTDKSLLSSSVKEFRKNDILIARRNVYLKRAGIAFFDGLTSGDSIVLRIYDDCEYRTGISKQDAIRIIPFILNSNVFWAYANKHADGMNSKRISKEMLYDYEFDLPPMAEQKVLADKLWAAYRLKESYKKLLTATEEMVKSQFIEMFKDKGYPLTMIKSFADVSTGGTPSKAHPEYWNGDKPWVSAEDMKSKYVYDTCEKVTDVGYATCKIIPVDTLMFVCRGSIGVMAINKIECATNQSICRATCHDNVCNVEFLYHALMYQRDNIKKMGTGTSFKSLNQTAFSELEIELPPYDEQMKFVTIAKQADKSGFELRKSIEAIDKVIKSLINENL